MNTHLLLHSSARIVIFGLIVMSLGLGALASSFQDIQAIEPRKPTSLEKINFASSFEFNDILMDEDGQPIEQINGDDDWLSLDPGQGKTKYKTAIYIPRDYLSDVGVTATDEEIFDILSEQTESSIAAFESFVDATMIYDDSQIVVHSAYTLQEMLCTDRPVTCDNWAYLAHRALVDAKEADNDPSAYYAVYLFGGAGYAGAGWDSFVIGDWGFSLLFGYVWPNCGAICNLDRFYQTVRHEMGHGHGMPWHPGRYPNYPHVSIMDGGEWNQFYLLDHPGYPERYQVCQSSLNVGVKDCEKRFISPRRDPVGVQTLRGYIVNPNCETYDTDMGIYFSRSPMGLGWGNRYVVASGSITSYGEFEINLGSLLTMTWQRGYALTVADMPPLTPPDVNQFVHGYQFHYDPVQQAWCDDNTGQICHYSEWLVLQVPDSTCETLRPAPTKPFVRVTPTP